MPKVSVNALVIRPPMHRRPTDKTPPFDLLRVRHLTGRHKAGRIGVSVGGGQRPTESLAETLLRESKEEVNLTDLRLLSDLVFCYRIRGQVTGSGARLEDVNVLFVLCTSENTPSGSDEIADPIFCNPAKTFSLYPKEKRLESDIAAYRYFNQRSLLPGCVNFQGYDGISWDTLPAAWNTERSQAAA